jgi:ribonucleoside-triphosphate reductase
MLSHVDGTKVLQTVVPISGDYFELPVQQLAGIVGFLTYYDYTGDKAFAEKVLQHMREKMQDFQEETGDLFNLEATPAESTSYRLARHDKEQFPDIITSGTNEPFYTNSSQLPVDYTADVFEALDHQEALQTKYTGGTMFHVFMGEALKDWKSCADLVRTIANKYRIPFFTISPTYSICKVHGYLVGQQFECPKCKG